MNYREALNIEDLHRIARRRLPRIACEFLTGGPEDGVTLRENRAALERIRFRPRVLVDVSRRSQRIALFGIEFSSPFGIAPTGAAGLCGFEADIVFVGRPALPRGATA